MRARPNVFNDFPLSTQRFPLRANTKTEIIKFVGPGTQK